MPSFVLCIPNPIYAAMLAQATTVLPAECCGLLAGHLRDDGAVAEVTHRYPLLNALASPTEFLSDPQSMFAAIKDLRIHGTEVLAIYHSHPTSAPIPSRRDLERNYSESVMNLIIGLVGEEPEMRGWWLTATEYREGRWEIG